jgi:hypothetical protein
MQESSLALTIDATHQSLEHRLRQATGRAPGQQRPRDSYARTDAFLAAVSRHLAAVDEVIMPLVRRRLPDGHDKCRTYLDAARDLEQSLALVKARLYGATYASHMPWPRVWHDVQQRLERHNEMESALVTELLPQLDAGEHDELARRVYRSEVRAPTRPHPLIPHTGLAGALARRMWSVADRFWDTAEGRVIPEPVRPREHHGDSLMAQYLLGTPHFDDKAAVFEHRHRAR